MNKHILIALLAIFTLSACKSKKAVITGEKATASLSPKEFAKALAAKPKQPEWVKIVADVTVEQNGSSNAGVADIRLHSNEMVWVEIADPLIGIKAIRAIAMADSVAYQNRIDKNYFAGPYSWVERKLGTSIPFPYIFNVFLGTPFSAEAKVEAREGVYQLTDMLGMEMAFTADIEPIRLDCVKQNLVTPKDAISITYGAYKEIDGYHFPQQLRIEVTGSQKLTATFVVREITTGSPLEMPFKLNTKYERIQ